MSRQMQTAKFRGDPGIPFIGALVGGAAKLAVKAGKAVVKAVTKPKPGVVPAVVPKPTPVPAGMPPATQNILGGAKAVAGAVATGLGLDMLFGGKGGGSGRVGGRRINPLNMRALKRAITRQDRFIDAARTGLKGTKYTVAVRGSGGGGRKGHKSGCKCVACR